MNPPPTYLSSNMRKTFYLRSSTSTSTSTSSSTSTTENQNMLLQSVVYNSSIPQIGMPYSLFTSRKVLSSTTSTRITLPDMYLSPHMFNSEEINEENGRDDVNRKLLSTTITLQYQIRFISSALGYTDPLQAALETQKALLHSISGTDNNFIKTLQNVSKSLGIDNVFDSASTSVLSFGYTSISALRNTGLTIT